MIKRLQLVSRRPGMSVPEFAEAWPRALARACEAGPLRVVAGVVLHDMPGTSAPHDGIGMVWLADEAALARFEAVAAREVPDVIAPEATCVIHAQERVLRGADWLARRWSDPAPRWKHMSLARRAAGLTPQAFSEAWAQHAGKLRGQQEIPAAARGLAYVQNHPLASTTGWRYDAINEVYFADLASMHARIAFFETQDAARAQPELVSEACFVAVCERMLCQVAEAT